MRYGAVRFRCPGCGDDVFVALSCKRRGCPNCDAKAYPAYYTSLALLDEHW